MVAEKIQIRPFQIDDQERVQNLIMEGLAEHFNSIDPSLNPDLHDINASYLQQGALFLVVELAGELVGTGAMISETENIGRIVRVSVAKSHRRMGIGRLITENLIQAAGQYRFRQIVVETNDDWHDAIRLYQSCGFAEIDHRDGEIHMMLQL